jgi:hypothetical protein
MFDILNPFYCGTLLLVVGCLYIVRSLFGITIPALRILCGFLLAYAGICVIIGTSSPDHKITLLEKVQYPDSTDIRRYSDLFSQATLDLSQMPVPTERRVIELNNILGTTDIILNPDVPTVIKTDCACARVCFTDPATAGPFSLMSLIKNLFGTHTYASHTDTEPLLEIRSRAVFGALTIHNLSAKIHSI